MTDTKKVMLYSGGLDSFIISRNFDFDIFLAFNLGTTDNQKELERIHKDPFIKDKLIIADLKISQWEMSNKILPFRNNFLVLAAANYGNEITLGFTLGDTTKDKDYVFKSQMEGILNYFALDTHKVNFKGYPYSLHLPYKDATKTQMVKEYLEKGNSAQDLVSLSRSCYDDGEKECGKCRSCLRKYIAIENNGLHVDFAHTPTQQEVQDFYKECIEKKRHQKELTEIENFLNRTYGSK